MEGENLKLATTILMITMMVVIENSKIQCRKCYIKGDISYKKISMSLFRDAGKCFFFFLYKGEWKRAKKTVDIFMTRNIELLL